LILKKRLSIPLKIINRDHLIENSVDLLLVYSIINKLVTFKPNEQKACFSKPYKQCYKAQ